MHEQADRLERGIIRLLSIMLSGLFFSLAPLQGPVLHRAMVGMGFEMVLPARAAKEKEDRLSVLGHENLLFNLIAETGQGDDQSPLLRGTKASLEQRSVEGVLPIAGNESGDFANQQQAKEDEPQNLNPPVDCGDGLNRVPVDDHGFDRWHDLIIAWGLSIIFTMRLTQWLMRRGK